MPDESVQEQQDREVDALAVACLHRYHREGGTEGMSTLDLRSACHAAEREGDDAAVRALSAAVSVREAQGR